MLSKKTHLLSVTQGSEILIFVPGLLGNNLTELITIVLNLHWPTEQLTDLVVELTTSVFSYSPGNQCSIVAVD